MTRTEIYRIESISLAKTEQVIFGVWQMEIIIETTDGQNVIKLMSSNKDNLKINKLTRTKGA